MNNRDDIKVNSAWKCECGNQNEGGFIKCSECGRLIPEEQQNIIFDLVFKEMKESIQDIRLNRIQKFFNDLVSVFSGAQNVTSVLCIIIIILGIAFLGVTIAVKDFPKLGKNIPETIKTYCVSNSMLEAELESVNSGFSEMIEESKERVLLSMFHENTDFGPDEIYESICENINKPVDKKIKTIKRFIDNIKKGKSKNENK